MSGYNKLYLCDAQWGSTISVLLLIVIISHGQTETYVFVTVVTTVCIPYTDDIDSCSEIVATAT